MGKPEKHKAQKPTLETARGFGTKRVSRNIYARKPIQGHSQLHGKNGFVAATKLGTTNTFMVAATKNFAAATKRFVDRTKHLVVVTTYFFYPYFNKFCQYYKTFNTVYTG